MTASKFDEAQLCTFYCIVDFSVRNHKLTYPNYIFLRCILCLSHKEGINISKDDYNDRNISIF